MGTKVNNRGGPRPGSGRKPISPGESTSPVTIRMAQSQRDKVMRNGGGAWVRKLIDRAKDRP